MDANARRIAAEHLFGVPGRRHRKVEVVSLLSGDRMGRKISYDLTPTDIDVFTWSKQGVPGGRGDLVVPLGFTKKGSVKSAFSLQDARGRTLPLLTHEESSAVGASLCLAYLEPKSIELRDKMLFDIGTLATAESGVARGLVGELMAWAVAIPATEVSAEPDYIALQRALETLADAVPLLTLIPMARAETRQVIRMSFSWQPVPNRRRAFQYILASMGYASLGISIGMAKSSRFESQHLEAVAPRELECVCIAFQEPERTAGTPTTLTSGPVAHAHVYPSRHGELPSQAILHLAVPRVGLRLNAFLVNLYTLAFFATSLIKPDLIPNGASGDAIEAYSDAKVTLLLAAPAIAGALLARPHENALVSRVMRHLRFMIVSCSGLFVVATILLVAEAEHGTQRALWIIAVIVAATFSTASAVPYVVDGVLRQDGALARRWRLKKAAASGPTIEY